MNNPEILIISNTLDFGTDYITNLLHKRGRSYLRIDRDMFRDYKIHFDIVNGILEIQIKDIAFQITESTLKSIYYRAPVYLRDSYQPDLSSIEQLYRSQWTAFVKNLVYFENVNWVNHPSKTYLAENKLLQLKTAKNIGLDIPNTVVTNNNEKYRNQDTNVIMKSIDTALFKMEDKDAFLYSTVISTSELYKSKLNEVPIMVQDFLEPKIDIRTTIIGDRVYSVKILKELNGILGDWRLHKDNVVFEVFELPSEINEKLIQLNRIFGLHFSAIDLAFYNNRYYFIEINPTGEWAWLLEHAGLNLDAAICDLLEGDFI